MLNIQRSATFNEQLATVYAGVAITGLGAKVYLNALGPQVVFAQMALSVGQQLIMAPVLQGHRFTPTAAFKNALSSGFNIFASAAMGSYIPNPLIAGGADCAEKLLQGKMPTFLGFASGVVANLTAQGATRALGRLNLPTKNLAQRVLKGAVEGAISASTGQLVRNGLQGRRFSEGLRAAACMGGLNGAVVSTLEHHRRLCLTADFRAAVDAAQNDVDAAVDELTAYIEGLQAEGYHWQHDGNRCNNWTAKEIAEWVVKGYNVHWANPGADQGTRKETGFWFHQPEGKPYITLYSTIYEPLTQTLTEATVALSDYRTEHKIQDSDPFPAPPIERDYAAGAEVVPVRPALPQPNPDVQRLQQQVQQLQQQNAAQDVALRALQADAAALDVRLTANEQLAQQAMQRASIPVNLSQVNRADLRRAFFSQRPAG